MSKELEILRRALLREKAARKQAEKILEVKSLEIYEVNQELKRINDTLEIDIQSKTKSAIELAQFPKENPSPVMRVGEKGEMKFSNEAAHSLLAEIEKSHSSSVLAEILDIADSSIKTGKITTQEFKINKEYYKVTFAPIQSAGHVNLYYSNQTGYKLAEKKAIDNREKIETITRSLPDIVITINEKQEIVYLNQAPISFEKESLLNKKILALIPKEEQEKFNLELKKAKTKKLHEFEFLGYGLTDQPNWYAARVANTGNKNEQLVILTDINARKFAEEKNQKSHAELYYADKINQTIINGESIQKTADQILASLEYAANIHPSRIYLVDEHLGELELISESLDKNILLKRQKLLNVDISRVTPSISNPKSSLREVISDGVPIITSNVKKIKKILEDHFDILEQKKAVVENFNELNIKTIGLIPLVSATKTIGLIAFSANRIPSKEEKERILRIANQSSTAINNALNKQATEESEKTLNAINENSPDIILALNKDLSIAYSNRLDDMGGNSIIGKQLIDVLKVKSDSGSLANKVLLAFKGKKQECEIYCDKFFHEEGWFAFRLSPIKIQNNDYALIIATNIDARKKVEGALLQQQDQFDKIVNSGSDIIHSIDLNGKILFVNKAWLVNMGFTREEVIGAMLFDFIHPDNIDHCLNAFTAALNAKPGEILEPTEMAFRTKNGEKLTCEAIANPQFEEGKVAYVTGVYRDLSTRRKLELLNKEKALIISSSNDAILTADAHGEITSWNKGAEKLLGYTTEEAKGMRIVELTPKTKETIKEQSMVMSKLVTGNSHSYETIRKHKDGKLLDVQVSAFPLKTNEDGTASFGAIMRDITEARIAKEAILKSETLLKEAQSIAKISRWEWNVNDNIIHGPEAFLESYNLKLDALKPPEQSLLEIVHQNDAKQFKKQLGDFFENKTPQSIEFKLKSKKKSPVYIEMQANVELNKNGEAIRYFGILRDRTEQAESERLKEAFTRELELQVKDRTSKLEISQNELGRQVETLNQIALVSTIDTDGLITYANDIFCSVSGYSLPDLIGTHFADLYSKNQDTELIVHIWNEIENGKVWKGEIINSTQEGVNYWLHQTIVPFFNLKGEIEKYVAVSFDVTAEKELQQMLSESLDKEKELGELKSHFVAMASHQFRTPLAIIQSNSELLTMIIQQSEDDKLKSKLQKSSHRITGEISRMTQLMDDVLILGKLGAGHLEADRKPTNLLEIINEIQAQNNAIQSDGRILEKEIIGTAVELMIDEQLIRHVVENLISNAFKYSSTGNPSIVVNFKPEETKVVISDKGIGIAQQDLQKLFQPFYRGENVTDIQGTGLGLVIAKQYVELNGGSINIESEINEGTSVTLVLPNIKKANEKSASKPHRKDFINEISDYASNE